MNDLSGNITPLQKQHSVDATVATRTGGLERLLKSEAGMRRAESVAELAFLIANEAPQLSHARQVFVLSRNGKRFRVRTVSACSQVNRHSPRIRWIENLAQKLAADADLSRPQEFNLPGYGDPDDPETKVFPFPSFLWVPMKLRDGHVFAGLFLVREAPWAKADIVISERLAETCEHAWSALAGYRSLRRAPIVRPLSMLVAAGALAAGFYPVSLTVIAPVEVRSVQPMVIAAPIDGVVQAVTVSPDESVGNGQVLVKLADTALRNDVEVAEQQVNVAEARLKQVTQAALDNREARGNLAVLRSELVLAKEKRDYAKDRLRRSVVISPIEGVAIFTDKQDLIGTPVSVGERLMEIADPEYPNLRIDVPVADVSVIKPGAQVRAFLDSDPLAPLQAKVTSVSFEARAIEGDQLVYRIYAEIEDKTILPGLGVRGTAQVFGEQVPLAYQLFRRPISALRQRFGL